MNCPECDSQLNVTGTQCRKCGWGKSVDKPKTASNGLPLWISPPPYVKPGDDDPCGEPLEDGSGFCQKSVRQHREEFRVFGEKIARRVVRL